jgi:Tol biopolymer transport system component
LREVPLSGDRRPKVVVEGSYSIIGADVSPDGRWLAYASNPSGRSEVYVQPYGRSGARQQVSTNGGISPLWGRDGREIFYLVPDLTGGSDLVGVMAVPVRTQPTFVTGATVKLFEGAYLTNSPAPSPAPGPTQVVLVLNWLEELKARVAAGQAKQP